MRVVTGLDQASMAPSRRDFVGSTITSSGSTVSIISTDAARLKTSPTVDLKSASGEVGWNNRFSADEYLRMLRGVIDAGASPTRGGSGALGLAWVAAGRRDGYVETHMNSWDCLAAIALIREAGGYVSDFLAGEGLRRGNPILAATPGVRDALLQAAKPAGLLP